MDSTLGPPTSFDQNWMTVSGLATLASASAEIEPSSANEPNVCSRPKKRRASEVDDSLSHSASPLSNDNDIERTSLLSEAFGNESNNAKTLAEFPASASEVANVAVVVPTLPIAKLPAKSSSKSKATGKAAPKASSAKPKTAASSSAVKKKKPTQPDSDSSDSETSPRKASSPTNAVPVSGNDSAGPAVEEVVVPQRALTVRERHRECNRLVARKTRVKKKIELDLLQNAFNDFRNFNDTLRSMMKSVITREISSRILLDCNFQLPNNVVAIVAEMVADRECQQYITNRKVENLNRSFCITNPTVFDNPIAYASQDFGELTGYDTQSIIGYNCRFLQGPESDSREIYRLKLALERGCHEQAVIKNYRRDGSTFWNLIHIMPVSDACGKVVLVVGCHTEVFQVFSKHGDEMFWTKQPEPEIIIPSTSLLSSDPIPTEMSLSLTHDHDDLIHPHLDMHSPIHSLTHALTLPGDITLSSDTSLYQDDILTPKGENEELLSSDLRMGLGMGLGGKQESDKSMLPTPEGMYRGWDSFIAFPSSERDPYNHISALNAQSNTKLSSPSLSRSLSPSLSPSLSISLSDHNINLHTHAHSMGQQGIMQGNTIFDSISDKSPLRNGSVVWDAWKYGNGEIQKPHQLP